MLYLNYDHRAYSSRCMCCSRWRRIPNRNESVNLKNIFSLQEPEIEMKVHFWNLKSSLNPLLQECHGHHNLNMTFLFSYQSRPRTMQINTPYINSLDSSKTPFNLLLTWVLYHEFLTHSFPWGDHLVGGTWSKSGFQAQCGQPNSSNTLHNQVNCHMGFAPL